MLLALVGELSGARTVEQHGEVARSGPRLLVLPPPVPMSLRRRRTTARDMDMGEWVPDLHRPPTGHMATEGQGMSWNRGAMEGGARFIRAVSGGAGRRPKDMAQR